MNIQEFIRPSPTSGALFSKNRKYRYVLWRIWDPKKPMLNFICLNPSVADEHQDDPTLRRCIRFAKEWNYGGLYITNLFAYCTVSPKELMKAKKPIGKENDEWLQNITVESKKVVCAWGNNGSHLGRDEVLMEAFECKTYCLGMTKLGHPKHPLYVKGETKLKRFVSLL